MSEPLRENQWQNHLAMRLTEPACSTLSESQKDAIVAWVRNVVARMQLRMAPIPPFDPNMPLPDIPFPLALRREQLLTVFEIDTPWLEEWLPFLWLVPSDEPTGLARTALDQVIASLVETRRLENAIANQVGQMGFQEFGDDDDDEPPSAAGC